MRIKHYASEREILYKILFDMKSDMNDLKKLVYDFMQERRYKSSIGEANSGILKNLFRDEKRDRVPVKVPDASPVEFTSRPGVDDIQDTEEIVEESLSLADKEVEMIRKALGKFNGKRKIAANELGISERTLYRKIKEYGIEM